MKSSPAALLFALSFGSKLVAGYDIGCLYPESMPDPIEARHKIMQLLTTSATAAKFETPIVIRGAEAISTCGSNCLAYHDDKVLNYLTRQRPFIEVPTKYHNSFSRMLCMAQCYAVLSETPEMFIPYFELWGLDDIHMGVRPEVQAALFQATAGGDPTALQELLIAEAFHPYLIGQLVGIEIGAYFLNDGWNSMGQLTYDRETGTAVRCTGNCENFADTTGYFPKNYETGKPENSTTKYIVEGNDKHWQPLYEDDGMGFFTTQKHVTPQIGFTTRPQLFESVEDFPQTPDPEYDFHEEALLVVERLRETASDSIKKQKIEFYDNKLLVWGLIEEEMRSQLGDSYSFEDELLFIGSAGAGEYDALLMSWREKVRHDLVRPTTVIKRWGSDVLETFGGEKDFDGPVNISARDFQAFQRVMPHSEYPSGSSCLCTAYAEFTDAFTMEYYANYTLQNLTYGQSGWALGCNDNGEYPPFLINVGCNSDFVIPDMSTLLHECGQSRLWAGVHFTKAVSASEELCAGIGEKNIALEKLIRNGSTLGSKYYKGGERPQCSAAPQTATNVEKTMGGLRTVSLDYPKEEDMMQMEATNSAAGMPGQAPIIVVMGFLAALLVQ